MTTYLFSFLLPLVTAVFLTPVVRKVAIEAGAVDQPDARRIHVVPTPRMGGIAVAIAFAVPLFLLYFHPNRIHNAFFRDPSLLWGLGLGSVLILGLGIYDDIKGARPILKLLVQGLVAVLCYKLGFQIDFVGTPFNGEIINLNLLSLPITVLWVVGVINAVNLIDGVDGLASGVGFFACITLFVLSVASDNYMSSLIMAALAGALLGFLVFNFNPATIFLGDTGSMFLGFILAVTSVSCTFKRYTAFSILIPAMALGLPLLDTGLAMLRRALTGRPIMSADRHHIHHRLLHRGLSQRQVVLTLYGFCALLSIVSLSTAFLQSKGILTVIFIALIVVMVVFVRYMGIVDLIRSEWKTQFLNDHFGGIALHTTQLLTLRSALEQAESLEDVWEALRELREGFGLVSLKLELAPAYSAAHAAPFLPEIRRELPDKPGETVGMLTVHLGTAEQPLGSLQTFWSQEDGNLHPELMRLYLEVVRAALTQTLLSLPPPRAHLQAGVVQQVEG